VSSASLPIRLPSESNLCADVHSGAGDRVSAQFRNTLALLPAPAVDVNMSTRTAMVENATVSGKNGVAESDIAKSPEAAAPVTTVLTDVLLSAGVASTSPGTVVTDAEFVIVPVEVNCPIIVMAWEVPAGIGPIVQPEPNCARVGAGGDPPVHVMLDSVKSGGNTSVIVIPAVLLTGLLLVTVIVYCVGVFIATLAGPTLTTPMSTTLAEATTVVLTDELLLAGVVSTSPGTVATSTELFTTPSVLNCPLIVMT
jgi:hypothetical protein